MAFSEISVYQVKPDRTEDFEAVMSEASVMMKEAEGCWLFRLMRRTHQIKAMDTIRQGLHPDRITRVVKCVRYALYWEFDSAESFGKAEKMLYESHWKAIERCLIVPHDKMLGEVTLR